MSNSYDEPRAHRLREAYHAVFGGDELPVPVESIAEDLLGLAVEVRDDLPVSGVLLPSERRIVVRSDEPEPRRRFTIAHELGHWICQCLEGTAKPVYCRAEEIGVDPEAKALEREANIAQDRGNQDRRLSACAAVDADRRSERGSEGRRRDQARARGTPFRPQGLLDRAA